MSETDEGSGSAELAARKISSRTVAIAVAVALLVLGGVGAGIYFLTGDDTSGQAGTAETTGAAPQPETATSETPSAPGSTPAPPGPSAPAPAPAAEVGNAKAVAAEAIQAINVRDPEAMKKISCDPEGIDPVDTAPPEARAEIVSEPELTGDTATVQLKLTIGEQSTTIPLPLRKQNGTWCVD